MSGENSVTKEICEYLDSCPLEGFIDKLHNTELSEEEPIQIVETIEKVKAQESKLKALRQHMEYQMRKHRLQEFRDRL